MGQGSSYFVFIILEIPVPHIPKTHNFSSLCLIFLGYRSVVLYSTSLRLILLLLSIIPFLSVLRSASLHSVPSIHYILPLVPFIWEKILLFYRKKHNFYHFLNFRVIFVHFSSIFFIFTYFSPLKQQKFNENPYI